MAAFVAPIISALIPGVSSFLGGINSRNAAKTAATKIANAANTGATMIQDSVGRGDAALRGGQDDANRRLTDLQYTEQQNLQPYLDTGKTATDRLRDLLTNPQTALENTPGYQFTLDQGKKAIGNTAAARGSASSGNVLEDLTTFGQGLAGTTYQQAIQNALSASGQGLTASGQFNTGVEKLGGQQANNDFNTGINVAQLDANAQPKVADLLLQAGGAAASGALGAANAGNQMIGAGGTGIQDLIDAITKLNKNPTASGPSYNDGGIP